MHETAIAQSIVDTVLAQAEAHHAAGVESVDIIIGELTFLGIEQIEFWVNTNFEGTLAENATLNFSYEKGEVLCTSCGFRGPLKIAEEPAYHFHLPLFACPQCKSSDIEITKGKESIIKSIRLIQDD